MEKMYTAFQCKSCGKEFILITQEVKRTFRDEKYLVCPHCSSKKVHVENAADDLKSCMKENAYKRVHGVFRQVRTK